MYTVEELAEMFGIQERTIRRFLKEGLLKGRKLANRWYVSEESIMEYFNRQAKERYWFSDDD